MIEGIKDDRRHRHLSLVNLVSPRVSLPFAGPVQGNTRITFWTPTPANRAAQYIFRSAEQTDTRSRAVSPLPCPAGISSPAGWVLMDPQFFMTTVVHIQVPNNPCRSALDPTIASGDRLVTTSALKLAAYSQHCCCQQCVARWDAERLPRKALPQPDTNRNGLPRSPTRPPKDSSWSSTRSFRNYTQRST